MMVVCENGHDEIVYSGDYCPLCEQLGFIDEIVQELQELEKQYDSMEYEYVTLRARVSKTNPELLI